MVQYTVQYAAEYYDALHCGTSGTVHRGVVQRYIITRDSEEREREFAMGTKSGRNYQ